jgi:hypothetical protein
MIQLELIDLSILGPIFQWKIKDFLSNQSFKNFPFRLEVVQIQTLCLHFFQIF